MTRSPHNRPATIGEWRLRCGTRNRGYSRTTTVVARSVAVVAEPKIYSGPVRYVPGNVTGAYGWYVLTKTLAEVAAR